MYRIILSIAVCWALSGLLQSFGVPDYQRGAASVVAAYSTLLFLWHRDGLVIFKGDA